MARKKLKNVAFYGNAKRLQFADGIDVELVDENGSATGGPEITISFFNSNGDGAELLIYVNNEGQLVAEVD